jgi:PPOX class probable F420-dependent enzyme
MPTRSVPAPVVASDDRPQGGGMDDLLAAPRVDRFLREEPVIWLSTVRLDGGPHLVPTWFTWDGSTITIVSKPAAQKVRNLRADRRAMLALGDAEADFDVGLVEATADLLAEPTPHDLPAGFEAKYAKRIRALGLTPTEFARTYTQVIRLRPRKVLGWHGRSVPRSVLAAQASVAGGRFGSLGDRLRRADARRPAPTSIRSGASSRLRRHDALGLDTEGRP